MNQFGTPITVLCEEPVVTRIADGDVIAWSILTNGPQGASGLLLPTQTGPSSSWSSPRVSPTCPVTARAASSVPAT